MENRVEFYLNKGMDQKTAEYFASGRKKPVKVYANEDFSLTIQFDNDEIRKLDLQNLLEEGTVFEPFRNWENFKRVYLDAEKNICWDINPDVDSEVEWNNKVDLCSDSCYMDSVPINKRL